MKMKTLAAVTAASLMALNLAACSNDDDDDEDDDVSLPIPGNARAYLLTQSGTSYAITRLFNSGSGNDSGPDQSITGLPAGEELLGMDFRPRDGKLYLLGRNGSASNSLGAVYVIDSLADTGSLQATLVSDLVADGADTSDTFAGLDAAAYGVDFNPQANALRLVGSNGENLRIPFGGASNTLPAPLAVISDTDLTQGGSAKSGIVGAAYTNNLDAVTSTSLLVLSNNPAQLFQQVPPNDGTLTLRGNVTDGGEPVSVAAGFSFDVLTAGATDTGFFLAQDPDDAREAAFGTIDLTTGALAILSSTDEIGSGERLIGLAMRAAAP